MIGTNAGSVRVYQYSSSNNIWIKIGQDIDGEAANDWSGISTSLNSLGNILAIGAPYNDGTGMKLYYLSECVYVLVVHNIWLNSILQIS